MSYRGFIDLILELAHSDPLRFEAFKRIDSALTELYKNVEGISVSPQAVIPTPVISGHWQRVGNSVLPLNSGDNVELQGDGRLIMLNGVYTPKFSNPDFRAVAVGSGLNASDFALGYLRTSMFSFIDHRTDQVDDAIIFIDSTQRTNPGAAQLARTGLLVHHYTQPDNGGDSSAILGVQTGGGSGITGYKLSETHRPAGWTNYWDSPQGAAEFGTSDGSQALLAVAGAFSSTRTSVAALARVDNTSSIGVLIQPSDAVFDSRVAIAVGGRSAIGSGVTSEQFKVLFTGETLIRRPSGNVSLTVERTIGNPSSIVLSAQADIAYVGSVTTKPIGILTNNIERINIASGGIVTFLGNSVILQNAALSTTATTGFTYLPSCAGTPTGTPASATGTIPSIIDSINNIFYFYSSGAWRALIP